MASTAPSKSRPLHNFELPLLKWNTDANSSAPHKRRRSINTHTRRLNPSSLSPLIDSPMRDSVSATPPHQQSPLRDSVSTPAAPHLQSPLPDLVSEAAPRRRSPLLDYPAAPPRRQSPLIENSAATSFSSRESSDYSVKQSPLRGESSSQRMKKSPIGGDVAKRSPVPFDWTRKSQIGGELVNRSPVRGDSVRHFPGRDSELESSKRSKGASIEHPKYHSKSPGSDGPKVGGFNSLNSEPLNNSERGTENLEEKSKTVEVKKSSKKILIKLSCKNNKKKPVENLQEEPAKVEPIAEVNKADEVQEEVKINDDDDDDVNNNNNNNNNMSIDEEAKIWNLRPRKPKRKTLNGNGGGGAAKKGGSTMPEKNKAQSSPLRNVNSKLGGKEVCVGGSSTGGGSEKKEKKKLTINVSLTKEEIEEDIVALTGSKPARRPKKRAKNLQKQLDYVFPGLWLVSITPETYKVSENYMKG